MSGKDVCVGWMDGLQAVQPRGGASAWDKHGSNIATVSTVLRMVCKIFECYKDPVSFSTPVQLSPRPFISGHCEMVPHVPGKWSDYVSHRWKSAWQEQGGRLSASHYSESMEAAAPLVSWEKRSIHYMSEDCLMVPQHVSIAHICDNRSPWNYIFMWWILFCYRLCWKFSQKNAHAKNSKRMCTNVTYVPYKMTKIVTDTKKEREKKNMARRKTEEDTKSNKVRQMGWGGSEKTKK
jgi:hypothetical protein